MAANAYIRIVIEPVVLPFTNGMGFNMIKLVFISCNLICFLRYEHVTLADKIIRFLGLSGYEDMRDDWTHAVNFNFVSM